MATDYGIDVRAIDDLPDPEQLTSGEDNVACALARCLLEEPDANEEIGDEQLDTINVRNWLAQRMPPGALRDLETQATRVLGADPRVESVTVSAASTGSAIRLAVRGQGAEGPFDFILAISAVSIALLRGDQ